LNNKISLWLITILCYFKIYS